MSTQRLRNLVGIEGADVAFVGKVAGDARGDEILDAFRSQRGNGLPDLLLPSRGRAVVSPIAGTARGERWHAHLGERHARRNGDLAG